MNSSELRGYLTGLILGDGSIDKGVQKRAFEIASINKDFIDKIQEDLSSTSNFNIGITHKDSCEKDNVNHKEYWRIKIKAHPYFAKKYPYFYTDERKRRITKESLSWLNIPGIANWYMSDGYICLVGKTKGEIKDRRVDLCTDRYCKKDVEKISEFFKKEYGWENSIIQRKSGTKITYRIRLRLSSAQDMFIKIYPYITKSFLYKLDLHYDSKPIWMSEEYYGLMSKIQKRKRPNGEMI